MDDSDSDIDDSAAERFEAAAAAVEAVAQEAVTVPDLEVSKASSSEGKMFINSAVGTLVSLKHTFLNITLLQERAGVTMARNILKGGDPISLVSHVHGTQVDFFACVGAGDKLEVDNESGLYGPDELHEVLHTPTPFRSLFCSWEHLG